MFVFTRSNRFYGIGSPRLTQGGWPVGRVELSGIALSRLLFTFAYDIVGAVLVTWQVRRRRFMNLVRAPDPSCVPVCVCHSSHYRGQQNALPKPPFPILSLHLFAPEKLCTSCPSLTPPPSPILLISFSSCTIPSVHLPTCPCLFMCDYSVLICYMPPLCPIGLLASLWLRRGLHHLINID